MKLLIVLLSFSLCIASMAMPSNFESRQLFAIDGPLYVDSASLHPAVLTTASSQDSHGKKKSYFDTNNRRTGLTSLQAQSMMRKLLEIHNDPETNLQFDEIFSQNEPMSFQQNEPLQFQQNEPMPSPLKRIFIIKQNSFAQNDPHQLHQFNRQNSQNDQLKSLLQALQFETVYPNERTLRVMTVPLVKPLAANDFSQHSSQLDQVNAQIDFLHQLQLNHARHQNDPMHWLQTHQLRHQNDLFRTPQFAQFNPQNDQFRVMLPNHQFDQFRAQMDLRNPFLQNQQYPTNFNDVFGQNTNNFQNNPLTWQVTSGMIPDENFNDHQFQGFGGNLQGNQFQNIHGNAQGDQFQNMHGNAQQDQFQSLHGNSQQDQSQNFLQNSQQQNNQHQYFGMEPTNFDLNDNFDSHNDFRNQNNNGQNDGNFRRTFK